MSDYDKNFLKNKYKELEKDLSKPKVRKPNDHVLLIDGLNTFIRAFSVNPSLNEDGSHVGGLVGFLKSVRFAVNKFNPLVVLLYLMAKVVQNLVRKYTHSTKLVVKSEVD